MAVDDSVQITSSLTAGTNNSFARTIVRKSNGDIVVVTLEANTPVYYTSADEGSTWDSGVTVGSQVGGACIAAAIDSTDNLHVVHFGGQDTYYYNQYDITTDTGNITDETIRTTNQSPANGHCVIAIDSSDTPWVVVNEKEKVMGTNYDHLGLYDRGGGSWTLNAPSGKPDFFANGEFDHRRPSITIDSMGTKHFSWTRRDTTVSDTRYNTFASGSFGTEETVSSERQHKGSICLDGSDVPITVVDDNVYKRSGGTWSGEAFSTDIVNSVSVAYLDSEIHIVWAASDDTLNRNTNTFGSFQSTDAETIEDTTNGRWIGVSTRWQAQNLNSPSTETVDIAVEDNTNTDLYYDAVPLATVVTGVASLSGSSTETTAGIDLNTGIASPTGSVTATIIGRDINNASASPSGSATATAGGVEVKTTTATAAGSGTQTASGASIATSTAQPTGSGTAAIAGRDVNTGIAVPAGGATATSIGTGVSTGAMSPTGGATASLSGVDVNAGAFSAAGSSDLASIGTLVTAAITGTAALAGSGAVTVTGTRTATATPTLAGSSTESTFGTDVNTAIASASGSASADLFGVDVDTGVVSATGSSTLDSIGTIVTAGVVTGTASPDGSASILVLGTKINSASASPTASATSTINGVDVNTGGLSETGSGSVTGVGKPVVLGVLSLDASSSLAGTGTEVSTGLASITGDATASLAGTTTHTGVVAEVGSGSLVVLGTLPSAVTRRVSQTGVNNVVVESRTGNVLVLRVRASNRVEEQ